MGEERYIETFPGERMNIQPGDLFLVKNKDQVNINFIVLSKEAIQEAEERCKVLVFYPEGTTKTQYLTIEAISHYVKIQDFVYFPVKE
jgi:hypothetical protein